MHCLIAAKLVVDLLAPRLTISLVAKLATS